MRVIYYALVFFACVTEPGLAQKVYRDHVDPHWFAGPDGVTNQFLVPRQILRAGKRNT